MLQITRSALKHGKKTIFFRSSCLLYVALASGLIVHHLFSNIYLRPDVRVDQTGLEGAEKSESFDIACVCLRIMLDKKTEMKSVDDLSVYTSFMSSEKIWKSNAATVVKCESAVVACQRFEAPPGSFRLVALFHNRVNNYSDGLILSTKNKDALGKIQMNPADNRLPSRPVLKFSSDLAINSSVGSGMIYLENGCARVSGCRKLGASKMRFSRPHNRCSGYTDQTVSNRTVCITEARGHNRVRCELRQSRSKQFYEYLWIASLGPYYTFQHFIIDKLPDFLVAQKLLHNVSGAKFLMVTDKRIIEILEYLGIDKKSIIDVDPERSFCSKRLLFNAPIPGKYGFPASTNYPRPPELFKYASDQFTLKRTEESKRDLIVYLNRGKSNTVSHQITNIRQVKSVLKRNAHQLKYKDIDPGSLSIKELVSVMQRARVIVGIHGGQMANIVFAQASKNTTIIEIAGRQTYWKSYYYNGMGSVFDYRLVPRLCKSGNTIIHPSDSDLKIKRCNDNLFVSIDDFEASLNEALNNLSQSSKEVRAKLI